MIPNFPAFFTGTDWFVRYAVDINIAYYFLTEHGELLSKRPCDSIEFPSYTCAHSGLRRKFDDITWSLYLYEGASRDFIVESQFH
jgi:hypothetical protein